MKKNFNFKFIIIFAVVLFKFLKMQNYLSNSISNAIMIFSVIIIIIEIFGRKKIINVKRSSLLILGLFSLMQIIFLKDIDLFMLLLIVIVFANEENAIKKIIKCFFISLIIIFTGTIILYLLGFLESAYLSRVLVDGTRVQRNSLGFFHPNETFIYFFFIIFCIYYLINRKGILFYLFTITSTYILYKFTLCRTGVLCMIIFLILTLFEKENRKYLKFLFVGGTIASFIMAYLGGDINNSINKILSIRPYIAHSYLESGAYFNIIGNKLQTINSVYTTLDNAYLNLILTSGLIIYCIYLYIYYKSGNIIAKDKKLSTMYIVILIYSCFESHTLNIGLNFLLIVQGYLLLTRNNEYMEETKNEED